jgi:hypothetical protein
MSWSLFRSRKRVTHASSINKDRITQTQHPSFKGGITEYATALSWSAPTSVVGVTADPLDVGVVALHNKAVRIAASVIAAQMAHLVVVTIDLLSRIDQAFPLLP